MQVSSPTYLFFYPLFIVSLKRRRIGQLAKTRLSYRQPPYRYKMGVESTSVLKKETFISLISEEVFIILRLPEHILHAIKGVCIIFRSSQCPARFFRLRLLPKKNQFLYFNLYFRCLVPNFNLKKLCCLC